MKDKLAPPEKKKLSYKKDHRTRTGEDDRAMRRAWASRKKRVNRKLRRKADATIRKAINPDRVESLLLGDDGTTNELIRKGLTRENNSRKWGVRSLGEHLQKKSERRNEPRETNRQREEGTSKAYIDMILALERDPNSTKALKLKKILRFGYGQLWGFFNNHPDWKERLLTKMERLQKEEERQLEKVRLKAEQKRRWKSSMSSRQQETK